MEVIILSASIVSIEKPAVIQLIFTPLQVMTLLLIIASKILSLFLAFNSLTDMTKSEFLCIYPAWVLLRLFFLKRGLSCFFFFLTGFGKFSDISSSNTASAHRLSSPSGLLTLVCEVPSGPMYLTLSCSSPSLLSVLYSLLAALRVHALSFLSIPRGIDFRYPLFQF